MHNCTFSLDVQSVDLTRTSSLSSRKATRFNISLKKICIFFPSPACSLLFLDKYFGHQYDCTSNKVVSSFLVHFLIAPKLGKFGIWNVSFFSGTHFPGILLLSINSFSIFSISLNKFCLKSRGVMYYGWHLGVCNLRLGFWSTNWLPHKGSVKCLFVLHSAQSLRATAVIIKIGNSANHCRYKPTSAFDGLVSTWCL